MRGPGDQRRRGRGAQAAAAAIEAREAAAAAFYDMDQAQKYLDGRVTVFEDLDAAAAAPARREFTALAESADAASVAYISVLDAHDLDDQERTAAEYDAARRAFVASTERLQQVARDLNGFAERLAPGMARLEAALDRLPPRLAAARDAVAAAEAAVAAAREAGMDASDPEAELARAKQGLARLGAQGLGGLGLDGALRAAEETRAIAEAAREAAAELPRMAGKVRNSLASVRTRVDVVAGRMEPVRRAMKTLLRGYSQACWQDLRGAPEAIESGVTRARERLNEASAHVSRAEWKQAQQALTAARTELNAADRRAGQVTGRVAELEAVAADPAAPVESVRFAVRDAQRLAMAQPGGAAPRHARVLDSLVERLERAPGTLTGAHPDYWAYLRELDAIKTAAGDVVTRIRAERAGS
ncbi:MULTISPECIES: molecular chaperone DnaJ [Actinomadura]|uniref:Molecular chaperone DnaJ n=1 Tax=Actinomadura litoris TaxID=2678616 RepID=A0A7K1L7R5_9ACTN|nr:MULTISPECIES: molecular chaperone DnaJ [Actinomadura]MBT2209514.1 molecular chaperone DnaJ [Actinomadura sp. NEAU-AAG7]MUN40205.1 molecular chaperone DnaJ [Actinomadura litoris]